MKCVQFNWSSSLGQTCVWTSREGENIPKGVGSNCINYITLKFGKGQRMLPSLSVTVEIFSLKFDPCLPRLSCTVITTISQMKPRFG